MKQTIYKIYILELGLTLIMPGFDCDSGVSVSVARHLGWNPKLVAFLLVSDKTKCPPKQRHPFEQVKKQRFLPSCVLHIQAPIAILMPGLV